MTKIVCWELQTGKLSETEMYHLGDGLAFRFNWIIFIEQGTTTYGVRQEPWYIWSLSPAGWTATLCLARIHQLVRQKISHFILWVLWSGYRVLFDSLHVHPDIQSPIIYKETTLQQTNASSPFIQDHPLLLTKVNISTRVWYSHWCQYVVASCMEQNNGCGLQAWSTVASSLWGQSPGLSSVTRQRLARVECCGRVKPQVFGT